MSATAFERLRREQRAREESEKQKVEKENEENFENKESIDNLENEGKLNDNESINDLDKLKVPELKVLAKEKGIEGYPNMKREELLEALKGNEQAV